MIFGFYKQYSNPENVVESNIFGLKKKVTTNCTKECEKSSAIHDRAKSVRSFHKEFAKFSRIGSIQSSHHVDTVRVGCWHFTCQVTVYKKINQMSFSKYFH